MTQYGLQMYSVRDLTKTDLRAALKAVAEMGYSQVEFAGFFGHSAEDVKAWLDEYGLVASGTHTGMDLITPEKLEETIAYHKAIGCRRLIVPGANWTTEENMEKNIATFISVAKRLREEEIAFGYHNHSAEFYASPYGKIVEDELYNRTDIELEIDTFWLFNAGIDPISYLEAHKERISVIHLKDGFAKSEPGTFADAHSGAVGKSLGLGNAPVAAVCDWAIKNGVDMVVESEGLEPTGCEEVKRCIDYLRTLEK